MTATGLAAARPAVATAAPASATAAKTETWLDAARMISIVAVVVLHVVAPLTWNVRNEPTFAIANVINAAARWCVPVFVMVSGALLLDPRRHSSIDEFYRRRLARIGLPLIVWTVVYLAWSAVRGGTPSVYDDAASVLQGRPYYHLWFLYMILGLYLVAPFLRHFTATASVREIRLATVVLIAFGAAQDLGGQLIGSQLTAFTLFVPYLGFFLAGYVIRGIELPARATPWLVAAFGAAVAATAAGTWLLQAGGSPFTYYLLDYLSLPTIVASIAIFVLFRRVLPSGWEVRHPVLAQATSIGAAASFGVYLVHVMVLELVRERVDPATLGVAGGVAAVAITTIAISFAIVSLMQRLPGLRSIV